MVKVLWIGSFLSKHRGSKGVSESLAHNLVDDGIVSTLASSNENKILRILEICWCCIFSNAKIFHIDVFSGSAFTIANFASWLGVFRRRKIIMTLHGGKLIEFYESNPSLITKVFERATYLQTPSMFLQSYFKAKFVDINYLPNSVDFTKFPYSRANVKPFSLLWVRGFMPIYNPKLAVEILYQVMNKFPQATLTMVGPDKGLLQETLHLAKELNVYNSIHVIGPVKNEELFSYYNSHQVYINTTSYESFGVALLEAAHCGIPIVSTDVGEIPYLWKNDIDCFLIPNKDPNLFAERIIYLFDQPSEAHEIALKASQKVSVFDWNSIKPKWVSLLNDFNQ